MEAAKLPKSLRRYASKIVDFEDDRGNQNGYWVHLVNGWINPFSETHIIHELTITECIAYLRSIERCSCVDCVKK